MNDFEKSMFIFFDEWGGSPHFQAEHNELFFWGVDVADIIENAGKGDMELFNRLFDLGWYLTDDGEGFVSSRWGSC
jgi:hypothetical protein